MQCGQGQGQDAHCRAVAAVGFVHRAGQTAFEQVAADAAAASVADVDGMAAQPYREFLGGGARIPALGGDQRAAQVQRHLRVVGDLAGPEP
jgi:hypothetical protein